MYRKYKKKKAAFSNKWLHVIDLLTIKLIENKCLFKKIIFTKVLFTRQLPINKAKQPASTRVCMSSLHRAAQRNYAC